jgi:hypothetical protein
MLDPSLRQMGASGPTQRADAPSLKERWSQPLNLLRPCFRAFPSIYFLSPRPSVLRINKFPYGVRWGTENVMEGGATKTRTTDSTASLQRALARGRKPGRITA